MLANYIFNKTAKYDQESFFAHFQILMEMDTEICVSHFWYLTFDEIYCFSVCFRDYL